MEERDRILLTELKNRINNHFIENGWITISNLGIHAALIDDEELPKSLGSYEWDIRPGDNGFSEIWDNGKWTYKRIGSQPIEPFVIYRRQQLDQPESVELPDDFRLYFDMRCTKSSCDEKVYSVANEDGDWEEVVRISNLAMTVKAKILRQYIAMRKMNLAIYFDMMAYSDKTYEELNISPLNNSIQKGDGFIYNYTSLVNMSDGHSKSGGWMMGKCILRYNTKDYDPDSFSGAPHKYESYIIGYDSLGDEIIHSCNKDTLSNYFVANDGKGPLEMTPVFFKKTVLDKYYGNPNKYEVSDGQIDCSGSWSLRIDNDQRDYVAVMLVDMGYLPFSEQQYWRGFNVARDNNMGWSKTQYKRWFLNVFCAPCWPDLHFKFRFKQINKKWKEAFGWSLFLTLAPGDEHYFKTLHCLTVKENDADFDEQILALTKITIDSLNQKELVSSCDDNNDKVREFLTKKSIGNVRDLKASIDKFECFLYSKDYYCPDMIEYLRKLQSLRSNSVAHRKSANDTKVLDKIYQYFQIGKKTEQEALENIFVFMIRTLNTLETCFLKK